MAEHHDDKLKRIGDRSGARSLYAFDLECRDRLSPFPTAQLTLECKELPNSELLLQTCVEGNPIYLPGPSAVRRK